MSCFESRLHHKETISRGIKEWLANIEYSFQTIFSSAGEQWLETLLWLLIYRTIFVLFEDYQSSIKVISRRLNLKPTFSDTKWRYFSKALSCRSLSISYNVPESVWQRCYHLEPSGTSSPGEDINCMTGKSSANYCKRHKKEIWPHNFDITILSRTNICQVEYAMEAVN